MIAEVTIREALDASRDRLLGDTPRTVVIDPRCCTSEFIPLLKSPPAGSLLEECCAAVRATDIGDTPGWITVITNGADELVTRAVIQTLIDRTESPTTCAELTRILAGEV